MVKDDGSPDTPADQARQRERRYLVVVAVVVLVLVGVGGTVAGVLSVGSIDDDESLGATGWLIVGVATAVVIVVSVSTFALILWRRRRGSVLFARSPLWELPRQRDRSALVRALRRGDRIAPERRDLARRVARDFAGRRGLVWIYLGVAVVQGANALVQDEVWLRWMHAGTALLFFGLVGYFVWLTNRMRHAASNLEIDAHDSDVDHGQPE